MKATDYCNMDCRYCYVPAKQRNSRKHIPLTCLPSMFRKMFDWQQSYESTGKFEICWSGGEVLTLPLKWWREMIQIQLSTYDSGNYTFQLVNSMQTNLTLLTDEMFEFVQKHRIGIGTSIDGPKRCMDKTRVLKNGQSAFDIIFDRLRHLKDKYKTIPGAIVVLAKSNVKYIEEIWNFFKDLEMSFQINTYHYAPSSVSRHKSNQITIQEYLDSMRHLFDIWSKGQDSVSINVSNFTRITNYLLYGKITVCHNRPTCADSFYMVRWNGDVYPCNEFSGADFEQEYCYGNLIRQDWREIRDHPTRQVLLERAQRIQDSDFPNNKCKGCRYWSGCHGGCFHCVLKNQYYNNLDCSPQTVASLHDPVHCAAKYGLYKYIENQLRSKSKKNLLPVLLYPDRVTPNRKMRKRTFYNYHRQLWKLSLIDPDTVQEQFKPWHYKLLGYCLKDAKNILHVCCGSGLFIKFIKETKRQVNVLGIDYRFDGNMDIENKDVAKCDGIIEWEGWQSKKQWDAIGVPIQYIHVEDIAKLLSLCKDKLRPNGIILVYSTTYYLHSQKLSDITEYKSIKDYNPKPISINCGGISYAMLS